MRRTGVRHADLRLVLVLLLAVATRAAAGPATLPAGLEAT